MQLEQLLLTQATQNALEHRRISLTGDTVVVLSQKSEFG